jgi:hypothetical protein
MRTLTAVSSVVTARVARSFSTETFGSVGPTAPFGAVEVSHLGHLGHLAQLKHLLQLKEVPATSSQPLENPGSPHLNPPEMPLGPKCNIVTK